MNVTPHSMEQEIWKNSIIHNLDGRVKLLLTFMIVIYSVYTTDFKVLFLLEIYLIIILLFSKVSISYFIKRVLMILPFGGFIAIFQPFIKEGLILYTFPFGLAISYEGTIFGLLLLSRLIVCLSAIVLLSSVSSLDSIVNSMRKLGFPKIMAMILNMTVRYLFVFFDELENITKAQKSRCFSIRNKKTSYSWKLKQIAYTIMMLFLNSFEKGESVYYSMLARAYSGEAIDYNKESSLMKIDYGIIAITLIVIISVEISRLNMFI